jgi:hypothetical protein
MSSMPALDQTPPAPPDVSSQMGGSPFSGVSAMMQQKSAGQQDDGQVNPKGSLITMSEAIKKVVDQMAKMEPSFAPFGDRIRSLLDAGVGAATSGSAPDQKPPVMSPSQRPGEQGASAPGQGFPG